MYLYATLSLIIAYLFGAIPFGLLVAKWKGVDIRTLGSGNTGATNVFRMIGPIPGVMVFTADFLKGFLACWLMHVVAPQAFGLIALAGALAIIGHSYSIFMKGKGGKSAATGLGVLCFLSPLITIVIAVIFIVIAKATRYVSLATLICATLVPLAFLWSRQPAPYLLLAAIGSMLIIVRHRANIERLRKGIENKI